MIFDYRCEKCKITKEFLVKEKDKIFCPICKTEMKRLFPSTMDFRLIYNPKKDKVTWGNEGFSETQRNREIKEKHPKKYF